MRDDQAQATHPSRFVYLMLSHGDCTQAKRLCETLRRGSASCAILMHHDAKDAPPDGAWREQHRVTLVQPRINVHWGDISMVDAMLAGVRAARTHTQFDWLVLLSGQDYPLRPLADIERDISTGEFDAYVRAFPVTDDHYGYRYFMRYWRLPALGRVLPWFAYRRVAWWLTKLNRPGGRLHVHAVPHDGPWIIGMRTRRHPFDHRFRCHKGSQWFTLSSAATRYMIDFVERERQVYEHYCWTLIPDESLLQTVLKNAASLRVSEDNRRFVLWDETKLAHPVTLSMCHLDEIIGSGKDFGRKFHPEESHDLLDFIDRVMLS